MASTIRIKRSGTAGAPGTLKLGELAYSHLANNGANGGDILYIGAGTVDGNGDAPVIPIGGNYYVTQINNATDANTASRIVRRNASGNFSAGTITAALSGNATTATTLETARTINGTSFNGSANITITAANPNALTIGTGLSGTSYDGSAAVTVAIDSTVVTLTGTQTLTNKTFTDNTTFFQDDGDNSKKFQFQLSGIATGTTRTLTVPNVSGTLITSGDSATVTNTMLANSSVTIGTTSIALGASSTTLAGLTSVTSTGFTGALTGNASTATTLATSRNFSASGDATATAVGFNGSANVDLALTLATTLDGSTNKIAGTFGSAGAVPVITVDAKGRVTAITTAATSSALSIAGTTGTDTVTVGTDTLTFAGGTGVTTAVTNNQVSFAIGQAVGTTSNVTFNDVSVTGNLTVNGTTTTVNSTTVTIDDPIFTLGGDTAPAADDNKDRGIEFRWHNGTAAKVGFFGFDDSTGYLTFIPDATNSSEVFSGTQGDIQATNFRGALVGNASTATALATSRNFSASGDASASAVGFTGAANVDLALTLATVNSNIGPFGSSTSVPTVTVNAKGLVTAVTTNAIPTATSSVLGLASFNSSDFLVTAGAVTIATVDGGTY